MKYKARKGAMFGNKKAQIYGEALEEISTKYGGTITPQEVVKEARNNKSPLHDYFEWDDKKAGKEYRIWQGRMLINSIEVTVTYNGTTKERKRYLNVRTEDDEEISRTYVVVENALTNKKMRKHILQNAISEASYWQKKYEEYSELSDIFKSINSTKKRLKLFD